MKLFDIDLTSHVVVVAEIGNNHEGDVERAKRLVTAARQAGADAVKFQAYSPCRLWAANESERLARAFKFNLGCKGLAEVGRHAEIQGVPMFCSAVTEDVVPWLKDFFPSAIKVASGDVNFDPVLRRVAEAGCPMIVSTGFATLDEVRNIVGKIAWWMREPDLIGRLVLMHTVPLYPTPVSMADLTRINLLAGDATRGYSNHVAPGNGGQEVCVAAVALGARVVEVHFTDGEEPRENPDHIVSFNVKQLLALTRAVSNVNLALTARADERIYTGREKIRKGIVAARHLLAGTLLAADDMMFARPAMELSWEELPELIGRMTRKELEMGETIAWTSLDER